MLNVYLDCDDVIVDMMKPYVKWVNETRGLELFPSDFKSYDWGQLAVDPKVIDYFMKPGIYKDGDVKPFFGAKEFVQELRERYPTKIITGTFPALVEEKNVFLKEHFNIDASDIIHTSDKHKVTSDGILIDDYLKNIRDHVYYNEKPGILYNHCMARPHANYLHKSFCTEDHLFACSYKQVLDILERLEKENV